jgi:diguanylate cyclase (GGDEF)-like protein
MSSALKPRDGIGSKIAKLVGLSVFLGMILLASYFTIFEIRKDINAKRSSLQATGYVYASAIADNIESRDRIQTQRVLRSISRITDILNATAYDEDGKTIVSMGNVAFLENNFIDTEPDTIAMLTKGILPVVVDIVRGGKTVGTLMLIGDISDIKKTLLFNILATIVASIFASLLAIRFSLPLQRKISKPIIALSEAMRHVSQSRDFKPASIPEAQGETAMLVGSFNAMINDIHSRDQALQKLAYYDALTGLPNRAHFQKMLDQMFADPNQMKPATVFLADIDNFHAINDAMSHAIGDAVLLNIAAIFKDEITEDMKIARLDGDEFAFIVPGIETQQEAESAVARFISTLYQPIEILGNELHITASVGVALVPQHAQSSSDVYRHINLALQEAKRAGIGRVAFFKPELAERIKEEADLGKGLRIALSNNELEVHYQPIVNQKSETVDGFEALARWKHPIKGYIPPFKFIPVAEKSGLISALGDWILRASCLQAKLWIDQGNRPRTVAVNISAAQILQSGFLDSVRRILEETQLPPHLLCLELTESLFVGKSMHKVSAMLQSFKDMGITTALDDFGTGYSSLSYLEHLPIDKLKIDRSFVSAMEKGQKNIDLVNGIINLAHSLGMVVVAEGAETEKEVAILQSLKTDAIQGYFYSKPMAAFEALAKATEIDGASHRATA